MNEEIEKNGDGAEADAQPTDAPDSSSNGQSAGAEFSAAHIAFGVSTPRDEYVRDGSRGPAEEAIQAGVEPDARESRATLFTVSIVVLGLMLGGVLIGGKSVFQLVVKHELETRNWSVSDAKLDALRDASTRKVSTFGREEVTAKGPDGKTDITTAYYHVPAEQAVAALVRNPGFLAHHPTVSGVSMHAPGSAALAPKPVEGSGDGATGSGDAAEGSGTAGDSGLAAPTAGGMNDPAAGSNP